MADINRVRKGLKCCTGLGCHHGCEYLKKGCTQSLKMDALEIINHQQAEIDRMKAAKNKVIETLEIRIETRNAYRKDYFFGVADGLKQALDLIKKEGEQE